MKLIVMKIPAMAAIAVLSWSQVQAGETATPEKVMIEEKVIVEEENWWSMSLTAAWDSLYVSEGRDNLDGKSLAGTTLEAEAFGFTGGMWFAASPDTDYTEFNAFLEYGIELGDFDIYAGYTYLNFPSDDADDNEIGAGIAYGGIPYITPAIDWYHSFEADGSFFEASLTSELEVTEWLEFEPFALFGWNEGYIAEGHNGANNFAVGLTAEIDLSENIQLAGYVAYNWAIDSDPANNPDDELLDDFFYGGVSITFSF